MNAFFQSKYSMQDLEKFRDENGFIDLTKTDIVFTKTSREQTGNSERIKNWVDFQGTKVLIKGEIILDQEKNYGVYAELISEEIARKLGIKTAHYDLIKFCDDKGNLSSGVLSQMMFNLEKEQLILLHDMIGDQPEGQGDFIDTTDYQFTVNELRVFLEKDGYEPEVIERMVLDYQKRLMFALATLDVDKHTENIAFITRVVNGKKQIELSPNFDGETALMLDNDISTIGKLLEDYIALKESVDQAHPRIGTLTSIEEGGFDSFWKDTLETLCEQDEVYDFYANVLKNGVNMDAVLANVETRIKAPLPEQVRLLAKYSYNLRKEEMQRIMEGEIDLEETTQIDASTLLAFLVKKGVEREKIQTREQLQIGKSMQENLTRGNEISIGNLLTTKENREI